MVIEILHPYTKMFGVSYLCRDCPAHETMQHAQSISRDVCKRLVGIGTVCKRLVGIGTDEAFSQI